MAASRICIRGLVPYPWMNAEGFLRVAIGDALICPFEASDSQGNGNRPSFFPWRKQAICSWLKSLLCLPFNQRLSRFVNWALRWLGFFDETSAPKALCSHFSVFILSFPTIFIYTQYLIGAQRDRMCVRVFIGCMCVYSRLATTISRREREE